LFDRIAVQATCQPDALALQAGDRALRYRDFAELIGIAARQFQAEGLGAGSVIGWLGHNSPEMLAALLACAKLGAVFVPLNWRLAAPELAAIASHAGLSVLKNTPELAGLARQVRALVLALVSAQVPSAGPPGPAPAGGSAKTRAETRAETSAGAAPQPGDVMRVYTSGTSGEPKGAVHTQAGMLANIDMALAVQGLTADDRVLAVLPLFHVGGLCIQVLPALAVGAAVNLHARFDASAWLHDGAAWRPTTSLLVPAVMQALLAHADWPAADLSSLRFINSGSQVVPLALIEAFHARGVPVAQVYGSTETGPVSIALRPEQALAHVGSVGRPAPGVRLRLVDVLGADVKGGTVGEIWLQAPNLMRGYHRLPTGAGWVAGWFATGDLARSNADGFVTVVGRSRDLIISGGENIHPAEIENLAATWPGVAEAAVVGLPDARWGEVPVLVLVAQPAVLIDLMGLRAEFDRCLARFKHPRRIVVADALPHTALGKVQKAALRRALQALDG
jgi:fatty-acyl-CoA synthase